MKNATRKFLSLAFTLAVIIVSLSAMTTTAYATTYSITLPSVANGTVTTSSASAEHGTSVSLTATPNAGYQLKNISGMYDVDNVSETFTSGANSRSGKYFRVSGFNMNYGWRIGYSGNTITFSSLHNRNITQVQLTVGNQPNTSGRNTSHLQTDHGSLSVTGTAQGSTVTITGINSPTVTVSAPEADLTKEMWTFTSVTITGGGKDALALTDTDNKNVKTFTMPASNVTISAEFESVPHTHTLTDYTVDGATITATCSTEGCPLPQVNGKHTATLTISAPTQGGGAAVLSGDSDAFGVSASDVKYAQKSGGTWGTETSTAPGGNGFFKASITVSNDKTISVTYGVSAITVQDGITNGTVTAPVVATVNAVVPLTITPNIGYKLDTLTVQKASGGNLTVTNNSFTMPEDNVTVNAAFKQIDYKISADVTSGSITPPTAHYNDNVRLVITPYEGYGVVGINIPGVTLNLISRDSETGVEVYGLTMPNKDITVDVKFDELTAYTIFYKAASGVNSVSYRFYDSDNDGFVMQEGAKLGDVACFAGQMIGAKGKTSVPISFKTDSGNWTSQNCPVTTDLSSIDAMNDGSAILIEGEDKVFIIAFTWGDFTFDGNSGRGNFEADKTKYRFVSANATKLTVPDNPSKSDYDFVGWSYTNKDKESKILTGSSMNISGNIEKTTICGAVWKRQNPTVTYDLDGGSWSRSNSDSVAYEGTLTKPANPTKEGYALDRWVVKSKVKERVNGADKMLFAGSEFDFSGTKIIENLTLKATWKHVHTYVNFALEEMNDLIPDLVTKEFIDKYGAYAHFTICVEADDYTFVAHQYDENGKCDCGAVKPNTDEVTLERSFKDRNDNNPFKSTHKKNSTVSVTAPSIGTDKFQKWEYRLLNGSEWKDFMPYQSGSFVIPVSIRLNGVYSSLTAPQLTLKAERYEDGLLFSLQYLLPTTWQAKYVAIIWGDNHKLRYMKVKRTEALRGYYLDYYDWENNALNDKEVGKDILRQRMINSEAVNIPGDNDSEIKEAQNMGYTSGLAYAPITGVKDAYKGNRYFYALGFVEYAKDSSGNTYVATVGPIAVTYNGTASAITETN